MLNRRKLKLSQTGTYQTYNLCLQTTVCRALLLNLTLRRIALFGIPRCEYPSWYDKPIITYVVMSETLKEPVGALLNPSLCVKRKYFPKANNNSNQIYNFYLKTALPLHKIQYDLLYIQHKRKKQKHTKKTCGMAYKLMQISLLTI